ncbi:MAG: right-handed parallel beta-helix repeat-containing protein [Bacteroidales bacterium]|nr:right-handed parallel beta-helix repeat-containing protein [Bacteroidales bacterium]
MKQLFFLSFLLLAGVTLRAADYDVRKYGAKGDGVKMNTEAIQKAIDACSKAGGGRVVLTDGVYLTGPIQLKDGVDLHLERTARLLASPNIEDFPEWKEVKHVESMNLARSRNACVIFADEAHDIAITGEGTIDGNGTFHVRKRDTPDKNGWEYERIYEITKSLPRMVFFTGCSDVRLENVTMVNQPAGWGYWIHDCDRVSIRGLRIFSELRYPNNDGIHLNCSRDVTISDCQIETGDDCIVLRANSRSLKENKVMERAVITNCVLRSRACGIRVGWRNDGVIRNCTASNLVITDSKIGIGLHLPSPRPNPDYGREATRMEHLLFSDIVMDGIYGQPIQAQIDDSDETHVEAMQDIRFSNVRSFGRTFPLFKGRKDVPLRRFVFDGCRFVRTDPEAPFVFQYAEGFVFNNTTFETL